MSDHPHAGAPHVRPPASHHVIDRAALARERAAIDRSTRLPVLAFFASAVFWLVVGSVFAMLASIKLHSPGFLGGPSWLTFGRVRPVHLNIVAYGWASMAGVGTMLWLMARLSRAELRFPRLLVAAAMVWNVAILAGSVSILAGYGTSIEYLEFPPFVPPLLTVAYAMIGLWAAVTFSERREPHVYVSQWYLFGALFWFPWLYTAVNIMLVLFPIKGVTQVSITWWYGHNILGLWFTPIGLATVYYLLPKVIGRPIHSYYLSILGFWSLALFYNWNGAHHLIGGPVPAWLVTMSVVASMMMLIPVGTVAINHHMTMVGHFRMLKYSPTLRFIVFGAMCYSAVSVQGSFEALRSINLPTKFTHFVIAHAHLGLYGFFTMVMFGAMYYIMPRLTGWEWASSGLIRVHFWGTAIGILLYFVPLTYGGFRQGLMMLDPKVPFIEVVRYTVPYLWGRSAAGTLMTVGHLAFATLFVMNLFHLGRPRTEPTLMTDDTEGYARELAILAAEADPETLGNGEEAAR
jgi:cytochrome c oxidase cbb3-type subunit I